MQGSARQISGNASGASRKSTASSKARRLERIKIERLGAEMEARQQSKAENRTGDGKEHKIG